MEDLFGTARFEQHLHWRCSGWVDGDHVDDTEPRTFVIERHGDRWLMTTGEGSLVAVGDGVRDLVASGGGLERRPAPRGFDRFLSAGLLRRIGLLTEEWVGANEIVGKPRSVEFAGRPAVLLGQRREGYEIGLGVDAETGIWTHLRTAGATVSVGDLTVGPHFPPPALATLDYLPDLDLSRRAPVTNGLAHLLDMLREAAGLDAEVLDHDEEAATFRLVLLDADGEPAGLVTRARATWAQSPQIFGGAQSWQSGPDWQVHVDTKYRDDQAASRIQEALRRVLAVE